MAVTDVRKTVLQIVNEVQRRMALTATATLTDNNWTLLLLQFLNEVIDDLSSFGEWPEQKDDYIVTAQSSVATYAVEPGPLVQAIYEVAFQNRIAPLEQLNLSDINRLARLNSFGVPNQYCVVSVNSAANPVIKLVPCPGLGQAGQTITVTYYKKPALLTTSDAATVPMFDANLLIVGTHAKALLEENGGERTQEYQTQFALYERMKADSINRYTADTGWDMRLRPRRGR